MRRRLRESFTANEQQAMAALARRWGSTRYVQDMAELLARLEGELAKDGGESHGIQVIVLRTDGAAPLDPELFRLAAAKRVGPGSQRNGHEPGPPREGSSG